MKKINLIKFVLTSMFVSFVATSLNSVYKVNALGGTPQALSSNDDDKLQFQRQFEVPNVLSQEQIDNINNSAKDVKNFKNKTYSGYYSKTFENLLSSTDRALLPQFPIREGGLVTTNEEFIKKVKPFNTELLKFKESLKKEDFDKCYNESDLKYLAIGLKNVIAAVGTLASGYYKLPKDQFADDAILPNLRDKWLAIWKNAFIDKEEFDNKSASIALELVDNSQKFIEDAFNKELVDYALNNNPILNDEEKKRIKLLCKLIREDYKLLLNYFNDLESDVQSRRI